MTFLIISLYRVTNTLLFTFSLPCHILFEIIRAIELTVLSVPADVLSRKLNKTGNAPIT